MRFRYVRVFCATNPANIQGTPEMLVGAEFFNDFYAFFDNDCGFDDVYSFRSRFGRRVRPELEALVCFFAILH